MTSPTIPLHTFSGFADGKPRTIQLPTEFLTDLLPLIDNLDELKITLFAFYAIQQREGRFRYVTVADFVADAGFVAGLSSPAALPAGLERACIRGSLLRADLTLASGALTLYFINAEPGREAVAQIERGLWQADDAQTVEILPERPNIYRLYEENIGPLTPLIAEALKEAEAEFPLPWVTDAFRAAIEANAPNWKYVRAVLDRWKKEGRRDGQKSGRSDEHDPKRFISGKYADFVEW